MIKLKVDVVQMVVGFLTMGHLIVLRRDIALLLEVLGTHLSDMHVNEVGVVAINLKQLFLVAAIDVDVVGGADVLVRQDNLRVAVLVAWRVHVPHL